MGERPLSRGEGVSKAAEVTIILMGSVRAFEGEECVWGKFFPKVGAHAVQVIMNGGYRKGEDQPRDTDLQGRQAGRILAGRILGGPSSSQRRVGQGGKIFLEERVSTGVGGLPSAEILLGPRR